MWKINVLAKDKLKGDVFQVSCGSEYGTRREQQFKMVLENRGSTMLVTRVKLNSKKDGFIKTASKPTVSLNVDDSVWRK